MKNTLLNTLCLLISLSFCILVTEFFFRTTGIATPWTPHATNEPSMNEADTSKGWRVKPGKYVIAPFSPEGHETHYSFLKDGSRLTSRGEVEGLDYDLIFLGCSFVEGFAISDEDTLAWKLQSNFPYLKIGNFGVGGYSTYQMLLLLEDLYERGMKPKIIIYGFMPFHEERNIANSGYLALLSEYSSRGEVGLPYCSLDDNGNLIEHVPKIYPDIPLREYSAWPNFLAKFYYRFLDKDERKNRHDGFAITSELIKKIDKLTSQHGTEFYIAMLGHVPHDEISHKKYKDFFQSSGFKTIDGGVMFESDYVVRGEGHPNEIANTILAEKIKSSLEAQPSFCAMTNKVISSHKQHVQR